MALCSTCSNISPLVPLELRALEYILSVIPQLYSTSHLQFLIARSLSTTLASFYSYSFFAFTSLYSVLLALVQLIIPNNPTSVNPV